MISAATKVGLPSASRMHVAGAKPLKHDSLVAVGRLDMCHDVPLLCFALMCCATQINECSSDIDTAILASCRQVQIIPTVQAVHSQS